MFLEQMKVIQVPSTLGVGKTFIVKIPNLDKN
jgi:hypothetical protein